MVEAVGVGLCEGFWVTSFCHRICLINLLGDILTFSAMLLLFPSYTRFRDDGVVSVADWPVESACWGSHLTLLFYALVQFNRIVYMHCTIVYVNVQWTNASMRVHQVVHNHYNFSSRIVQTESQKCCVCSFLY